MEAAAQPRSPELVLPPVDHLVEVFVRPNPARHRGAAETIAHLAWVFAMAVASLSQQRRLSLLGYLQAAPDLVLEGMPLSDAGGGASARTRSKGLAQVEESRGEGLGEQLTETEGRRRLHELAGPMRLEEWAGPVAGSTELERDYGIRRSTLQDWRAQGAVVGLLKGTRKHVFPVAQFVDGRPIEGIGRVVGVVGSPRTAWLWLTARHPGLRGRAPLELLRAGELVAIVDLAKRDFGQP